MTLRKHLILTLICMSVLTLATCASVIQHTARGNLLVHTITEAHTNVHLVKQGENIFLIDSGLEENAATVDAHIQKLGIDPAKIRAIVVTHGHADHAGGALFFQKKYGTKIILGKGDEQMFQTGKNEKLCPVGFIAEGRVEQDQNTNYSPSKADIIIDKETPLKPLTGIDGTIIPTSGHTKGSISVIINNFAFVGDLFRGTIVGTGATQHFFMCDLKDNKKDIADLLNGYKNLRMFFPGHFGPVRRKAVEDMIYYWPDEPKQSAQNAQPGKQKSASLCFPSSPSKTPHEKQGVRPHDID